MCGESAPHVRLDLPRLALGFVEAGGQPDPVAQFVADGVESLADRGCQAEFARIDDAAGDDELEGVGAGGAGRFGEQRVIDRRENKLQNNVLGVIVNGYVSRDTSF